MSEQSLVILLAAGKSTRMKSDVPKVLHPVCGKLLIEYVLDATREAGASKIVVVVGHQAELVKETLAHHPDVEFALQAEQQGTGHAVMMCEEQLASHQGPVMILAGDTPLLKGDSLKGLLDEQRNRNAACVIGTAVTEANEGLGRVVRNNEGDFLRIVEEKDASPEEKTINEINTGCYVFDAQRLHHSLKKLKPENVQAEYYLTDCPKILQDEGDLVIAAEKLNIQEAIGVNTRVQLAEVTSILQQEIQQSHQVNGVTIVSPATTFIDGRVQIGRDTVLYPGTIIEGSSSIGSHCHIGPHAVIRNASLADHTTVNPFQIVE